MTVIESKDHNNIDSTHTHTLLLSPVRIVCGCVRKFRGRQISWITDRMAERLWVLVM